MLLNCKNLMHAVVMSSAGAKMSISRLLKFARYKWSKALKIRFFDTELGLKTQRDTAEKYGACRIVVVYGWIIPETNKVSFKAEKGNALKEIAQRNSDENIKTQSIWFTVCKLYTFSLVDI